ncbi:molybdopterin-dependent oxidoreductase (plasmid) [Rhodococcus opacus]|uniref:molybdopterin-containing oxidoreductase family protein n=1 Tax=Rhodococcus opacus TaxID=37919 RepID=UPI0034D20987
MKHTRHSFCRICINHCSILVDVEDGVATAIHGNSHNQVYGGYTCVKGRSQHEYLRHADRLVHSLVRTPDGHARVPVAQAMDEIAAKLADVRDRYGPRAIASYAGTMAHITTAPTAAPVHNALFDALGSDMRFDPNTIDKGGKQVAQSLLGYWSAPSQGFDAPEAILLIGINPVVTCTGFPAGSPKRWLLDTLARGCKLIVVDPRRTDVAQHADWYLQAAPGHDIAILAAMIRIVIDEGLFDRDFVARHVRGLPELTAAVHRFDPDEVARRAGISGADLAAAARCYGTAKRGYTMAGTGPNMAGEGTLVEYLVLALETLCGRWLRAGETVSASPTLLPSYVPVAQATSPDADWALPGTVRVRGLRKTRAGMPTATLPEEILTPGEGQVRALISWGGNPAVAFPDQRRTVEALESLELFVQIDPWYSASARVADYVIAPTMPLEAPSTTVFLDALAARGTGYGIGQSYAQYSPAVVERPEGSDVIEEWRFFHGLMKRLGYPVEVSPFGCPSSPPRPIDSVSTTDELIDILTEGSAISLSEVKSHPDGMTRRTRLLQVQPGDAGVLDRLDIGNGPMLAQLTGHAGVVELPRSERPYRLLCRRHLHVYNSSCNIDRTHRGVPYNPAFLHPDDMTELGVSDGALVRISSDLSSITAVAMKDPALRTGWCRWRSATDPPVTPKKYGQSAAAPAGSCPSPRSSIDTPGSRE